MEYSYEDKLNIIYFKNQLIHGDVEKLKEMYSDEEGYAFFLDTLNITLDTEPVFFLLDPSIMSKAEAVFYEKRFDYKLSDFNTVINEIIGRLNELRNLPDGLKTMRCRQYFSWQERIRETSFQTKDDFLRALAYDALVMERLHQDELGELDMIYFFGSTNYLAKAFPEFYLADERRITMTMNRLDEHAKRRWIWNWPERSFAKGAIKNMQKVKTKEE
jgi:hypothetical protein